MRILYIAHRIPYPPNKGDKIRSFNQVKFLGARHEVHLACLADAPSDLDYRSELTAFCQSVEAYPLDRRRAALRSACSLPTGRPLTLPYFYSPRLRQAIRRRVAAQAFDLIYVFSSSMAQYVLDLPGVPKVLDMVDVDSDKWRQYSLYTKWPRAYLYSLEWKRMQAYEREITDRFERTILIAEPEVQILRALNPQARLAVVPNGIDAETFAQPGPWSETPSLLAAQPYVVFTGAMDYFANVDGVVHFGQRIWPQVRRRVPNLRFFVVGMNPTEAVRRLALNDPSITVTGAVSDITPFLAHAAACVVPLRIARGVQNKILEAMAAGVPVVATTRALEGLRAQVDRDVLLADDPEAFTEALVRLTQHPESARALVDSARRLLKDHYSWPVGLSLLESVLRTVHADYRFKQPGSPPSAVPLV